METNTNAHQTKNRARSHEVDRDNARDACDAMMNTSEPRRMMRVLRHSLQVRETCTLSASGTKDEARTRVVATLTRNLARCEAHTHPSPPIGPLPAPIFIDIHGKLAGVRPLPREPCAPRRTFDDRDDSPNDRRGPGLPNQHPCRGPRPRTLDGCARRVRAFYPSSAAGSATTSPSAALPSSGTMMRTRPPPPPRRPPWGL